MESVDELVWKKVLKPGEKYKNRQREAYTVRKCKCSHYYADFGNPPKLCGGCLVYKWLHE